MVEWLGIFCVKNQCIESVGSYKLGWIRLNLNISGFKWRSLTVYTAASVTSLSLSHPFLVQAFSARDGWDKTM